MDSNAKIIYIYILIYQYISIIGQSILDFSDTIILSKAIKILLCEISKIYII